MIQIVNENCYFDTPTTLNIKLTALILHMGNGRAAEILVVMNMISAHATRFLF